RSRGPSRTSSSKAEPIGLSDGFFGIAMNEHFLTAGNVSDLLQSLGNSLGSFSPELIVCVGIVALLVMRLFSVLDRVHLGYVALLVPLVALGLSWVQWQPFLDAAQPYRQISVFQGMLVFDGLSVFMKLLLLAGTALVI